MKLLETQFTENPLRPGLREEIAGRKAPRQRRQSREFPEARAEAPKCFQARRSRPPGSIKRRLGNRELKEEEKTIPRSISA